MIAIHKIQLNKLPMVAKVMLDNPEQFKLTMLWAFRSTIGKSFTKDPHNYTTHMPGAIEFLKTGMFNDGTDTAADSSVIAEEARRLAALRALEANALPRPQLVPA